MKNPSLTPNETAVLEYICAYMDQNHRSPTFTEIQKNFNYASVNSVQNYVKQLERKGYLAIEPNQKRMLRVRVRASQADIGKGPSSHFESGLREIAVEAKVAAGRALEYQVYDQSLWVDVRQYPINKPLFAVQVRGESMIEDGIWDGDYLIVQKVDHIEKGMTAVCSIEGGGATVKKVYFNPEHQQVELRPANIQFQSVFLPYSQVRIEGKVIGLIRHYV